MPFPYAQTTFVNAPLFPVGFMFSVISVSPIVQHLRCHLFINKEISYTHIHTRRRAESQKDDTFSCTDND